ncbi:MAG TPA: VOC family protein [Dongiaceae bacterium]|nr:VOC family protein [Dongiaceae bacterium]
MIDHVSLGTRDLVTAKRFYDAVLAPLGYRCVHTVEIPGQGIVAHGYGASDETGGALPFWIGSSEGCDPAGNRSGGTHVAFRAASRKAVAAFHEAALKSGGTDNGAPGLRPHYHPDYYGAFIFDLDGNKVEACCHHPE